jgi:DNA-binding GntR family transcriptional regulator
MTVTAAATDMRALSPIQRFPTLAAEVADRVIMAIARGEKQPGERITEAELAAGMNISRVPAREAMQRLEQQGILVAAEMRGMRVGDFSLSRIAELSEARLAIEIILFRHLLPRCRDNPALVGQLDAIVDRMAEASKSGDHLAINMIDIEFHRTAARLSQNRSAERLWNALALQLIIVFCMESMLRLDFPAAIHQHRELCDMLRHGSLDDIEDVLTDHIIGPRSLLNAGEAPA